MHNAKQSKVQTNHIHRGTEREREDVCDYIILKQIGHRFWSCSNMDFNIIKVFKLFDSVLLHHASFTVLTFYNWKRKIWNYYVGEEKTLKKYTKIVEINVVEMPWDINKMGWDKKKCNIVPVGFFFEILTNIFQTKEKCQLWWMNSKKSFSSRRWMEMDTSSFEAPTSKHTWPDSKKKK